jgi:hypothetical protein
MKSLIKLLRMESGGFAVVVDEAGVSLSGGQSQESIELVPFVRLARDLCPAVEKKRL